MRRYPVEDLQWEAERGLLDWGLYLVAFDMVSGWIGLFRAKGGSSWLYFGVGEEGEGAGF